MMKRIIMMIMMIIIVMIMMIIMITMIMIMTIDNLIYQWNNEIDLFLHKGKHVFLVISTQVAKSETSKPTPQLAPQCESYSCSHGNTMVTHTGSASFTQRLPLFHSSSNNLTWLKKKAWFPWFISYDWSYKYMIYRCLTMIYLGFIYDWPLFVLDDVP
jgi:flagellar basal body-associated protein FliL